MSTVNELKKQLSQLGIDCPRGWRKTDMETAVSTSTLENEHNEKSLYTRLGGVFAIAMVVNRFSDALLDNPLVGVNSPNPQLREWSRDKAATRLPGLKFQRTLWVCDISGGPQTYVATHPGVTDLGLENGHCPLKITGPEFDAVAGELAKALDYYQVPLQEKTETLAAFAGHKAEVIRGSKNRRGCPFSN